MRANHNGWWRDKQGIWVVSNVSKILKWEQITTRGTRVLMADCCFQCFKDTKMRANHNSIIHAYSIPIVVSNVSKILKWEQITTICIRKSTYHSCFQCFKDTKMRANHNTSTIVAIPTMVVSNVSKILKWEQITTQ